MTPRLWSISALAVEFDLDRRAVAAALRNVPPAGEKNGHPSWRLMDALAILRPGSPGSVPDLEEARARKTAAEAELAEIAVAKARGQLVEISLVAKAVSDEYAATRAKLLALPSKLGPMLAIETASVACQDLIERGIVEALEELSRDGAILAADADVSDRESEDGEPAPAAEADGFAMG